MSERGLQWHTHPLQVRLVKRRGDPVHVFGHQDAAQRRGCMHQQCWTGTHRATAQRKNRELEEHDRCGWISGTQIKNAQGR